MIIFKINYNKKIGKNNYGHIISRHKEIGHKSLYIPIDLNYFNHIDLNLNPLFYLTKIKTNELYRNSNIILSLCLSGKQKGTFRYILQPFQFKPNNFLRFSNISNKIFGNTSYLTNFSIGDKIYNIEFRPFSHSKLCIAAKSYSLLLNFLPKFTVLKMPSNKLKYIHNYCYSSYGYTNKYVNDKNNHKAGYSRYMGNRPKVRGAAMNACDHPHGGGEGKSPIGRKTRYTFKGKKYKGIKTSK